jgi:DNA-binding transcriptional regulator YdaS (Cro superfamily)
MATLKDYLKTHTQKHLADLMGVSEQAVSFWNNHPEKIGAVACCSLEVATRGAITRMDQRPDLYGDLGYVFDGDSEEAE